MLDQNGVENLHAIEVLAASWPEGVHPASDSKFTAEFIVRVLGDDHGKGLRGVANSIHGLARSLRDRISADSWRVLQEIHQTVFDFEIHSSRPAAGVLELFDRLIVSLSAFAGFAADSMTRGQAWQFLEVGRRIERTAFVTQLLRDSLADGSNDPVLLEAILEIADSSLTYRRRYLTRLETHAVVDLLLADETNPHSAAFQLNLIGEHLATLPRDAASLGAHQDQRIVLKLRTLIQLADLASVCATSPDGAREGLTTLLSEILDQVRSLADAIAQLYFSHAKVSRMLAGMGVEAEP
jgi:uncharacterized alpha-E superfamily protein